MIWVIYNSYIFLSRQKMEKGKEATYKRNTVNGR